MFFITRIPSWAGYASLGSKPSNPLKAGVEVMLILLFFPFPLVGISITVSPSKSAPERRLATELFIPTASILFGPIILEASFCLLLTVKTGISYVPAWGYLTNATLLPSSYFGAYISVSFIDDTGNITCHF